MRAVAALLNEVGFRAAPRQRLGVVFQGSGLCGGSSAAAHDGARWRSGHRSPLQPVRVRSTAVARGRLAPADADAAARRGKAAQRLRVGGGRHGAERVKERADRALDLLAVQHACDLQILAQDFIAVRIDGELAQIIARDGVFAERSGVLRQEKRERDPIRYLARRPPRLDSIHPPAELRRAHSAARISIGAHAHWASIMAIAATHAKRRAELLNLLRLNHPVAI